MLSVYGVGAVAEHGDGRYDATRDARADARFVARTDDRASYVCWQRRPLERIESRAELGYLASAEG